MTVARRARQAAAAAAPLNLLVVSPLAYHPECGNGGGVICFRLLEALAARHCVRLLAFAEPGADEAQARRAIEQAGVALTLVPLPHPPRWRVLARRAAQWLGGPPAEAAAFDVPAMHDAVRAAVAQRRPDVAMLQFPYMAQYVADLPEMPVLMDVQDVFFVSRRRAGAAQPTRTARLKKFVAWRAWTRYERRHYARCRALMALSDAERAALHALVPEVPAFTNMAAIPARPVQRAAAAAALRVGFGGHFGHPPNLDALAWLSAEIAPRLVAQVPGVQIAVAGRGVPGSMALHPAIRLEGFVADYDAFVRSCAVFIAPLRYGGGVKIKVLEALACARPVVTTPVGAEGIPLGPEHGLMVAATAAAIADAVAQRLLNPAAAAAAADAAERGANEVARQFGVAGKVARIERAFAEMLGAPWPPPAGEEEAVGATATTGAPDRLTAMATACEAPSRQ